MIKFENVIKSFKHRNILTNLSFELPSKGLIILKGENGVGKTTLLNLLSGNDLKYKGEIYFDEVNLKKISNNKLQDFKAKNISYISQKHNLLSFLDDKENGQFDELVINKGTKEKGRNINTLSEGEQALVTIRRKLKPGKQIYICDEILSSLDASHQEEVLDILKKLKNEALLIVVQHSFELENLADIVIHLKKGSYEITTINKDLNYEKCFILEKNCRVFPFKLFFKNLRRNLKLKFLFAVISISLMSISMVGTSLLLITPSLAMTGDFNSLKALSFNEDQCNTDKLLTRFKDDIYYFPRNVSVTNESKRYQINSNVLFDSNIQDDNVHISQSFLNQLKVTYPSLKENEIYFRVTNNNKDEILDINLVVDENIYQPGFFVKSNYFNLENSHNLLFLENAYWNTEDHFAEYFNNQYKNYFLITPEYASKEFNLSLNNIEDNVIYVNKKQLLVDYELKFSIPEKYNQNVVENINFNEIFKNTKVKFLEYKIDSNFNYFIASKTTLNKYFEVSKQNSFFTIFLTDENRNKIFDFINKNNIIASFYDDVALYPYDDFKFKDNVMKRLESRNFIVKNSILTSSKQRVIVLAILSLSAYVLILITFILSIKFNESRNIKILNRDGVTKLNAYSIIFGPYILITVISMLIGRGISYLLGNPTNTFGYFYWFVPLNLLLYIVLLVAFIATTYCLFRVNNND